MRAGQDPSFTGAFVLFKTADGMAIWNSATGWYQWIPFSPSEPNVRLARYGSIVSIPRQGEWRTLTDSGSVFQSGYTNSRSPPGQRLKLKWEPFRDAERCQEMLIVEPKQRPPPKTKKVQETLAWHGWWLSHCCTPIVGDFCTTTIADNFPAVHKFQFSMRKMSMVLSKIIIMFQSLCLMVQSLFMIVQSLCSTVTPLIFEAHRRLLSVPCCAARCRAELDTSWSKPGPGMLAHVRVYWHYMTLHHIPLIPLFNDMCTDTVYLCMWGMWHVQYTPTLDCVCVCYIYVAILIWSNKHLA